MTKRLNSPSKRKQGAIGALLLLLVAAAYANHFQNSFHFDDFHTITDNPAIRDWRNLPRLLSDPAAFSVLLTHQVYRPVVSASLVFDYWLAGGLDPVVFHATTFGWFLALLGLAYALFLRWFQGERMPAIFAAALFGLHPVSAETVNYIIQRAEILSTAGIVAGLLLYCSRPDWRRYGAYLAPFVFACLAKPPALVFPLLLAVHVGLYEAKRRRDVLWAVALSIVAAGLCATLLASKIGPGFDSGGGDRALYRLTQTWVALGYFKSFFWPAHLSADSDAQLVSGFGIEAAAGLAFVAALLAATAWAARSDTTKPIAMGLAWFGIALAPTALTPLAEVANDHRMFFPFVGLSAAFVWAVRLGAERFGRQREAAALGLLILAAAAWATHQRNEVWRTEETLWLDVTRKSPGNGRGWMNYGLTQMAKGEFGSALESFERAKILLPRYSNLEVNLGIVKASLGDSAQAEAHFLQALAIAPQQASSHFYYARWLHEWQRYPEAVEQLRQTLEIQPADLPARHLLMRIRFDLQNWSSLRPLAEETLAIDPQDVEARGYLDHLRALDQRIEAAGAALEQNPQAESYLDLSLELYRAGRFPESIEAARAALRLRPDYAEAHNNVAAAANALERWDEGIAAAIRAVELDPQNQLARNNLAWAIAQKGKH